jgi:1-acyl-sn-glycerol-3-phosphate acyltransferase
MKEAQSAMETVLIRLQPGPRAWIRRTVRGTALAAVTLALVALWFVGLPFTWIMPSARRSWRRFVFQAWSRLVLRLCSVRIRVVGELAAKPCFLVANHLGYVDILVIAARVDATFVSMKELEGWPLFGFMARQFGTVFVDRTKKREIPAVNREIERAFLRSDAVVIFPEGRHTRGDRVLPFRPSLLEPAAREDHPVAWAVLHYATGKNDPPASLSIPWVGVAFWRQALVLLALERVDARLEFGTDVLRGSERKELAQELYERVAARFERLD